MAELKLRNCPFCGDNQQLNYVELSNGLHYIECVRCGAAPNRLGAWNRETAVKYWNSVNSWISCEDDLPEENVRCLVYTEGGGYGISRRKGKNLVKWECFGLQVTHYMPLPEPPKEDES